MTAQIINNYCGILNIQDEAMRHCVGNLLAIHFNIPQEQTFSERTLETIYQSFRDNGIPLPQIPGQSRDEISATFLRAKQVFDSYLMRYHFHPVNDYSYFSFAHDVLCLHLDIVKVPFLYELGEEVKGI